MIEIRENFTTINVMEGIMIPNAWEVVISLEPNNKHNKLFNKALERVQYYLKDVIDNSIFVSYQQLDAINKLPFTAQCHIFPDDPWDHLVGMCLFTKLNSICEEVFFVSNISITSHQAQGISHNFGEEDGGNSVLHNLFDEEDEKQYVNYWYKSHPQLFLVEDGLKLQAGDWDQYELTLFPKDATNNLTVVPFKKPGNDDSSDA